MNAHINREVFMTILGDIWPTWASSETVIKSFKRCGVTKTQLDTGLMQQDKFESAELITQDSDDNTVNPVHSPFVPESPRHLRRGTSAYWRAKAKKYEEELQKLADTPIDPAEIPALTAVQKFPIKKSKNFRITQVYGSLTGNQILEKRLKMEKEEEMKKNKQKEKADKVNEIKQAFQLCETECKCGQDICKVKGLKKCPVCGTVLKSGCSKAMCKMVSTGKPEMIIPAVDRKKQATRGVKKSAKVSNKDKAYAQYYSDSDDELDESNKESSEVEEASDCSEDKKRNLKLF